MYYVYILRLSDGTYYKGLTKNIDNRLSNHESRSVKTTKDKLPFNLIHVGIYKNRFEARKMEKYFKSGYGREIIQELSNLLVGVAEW